MPAGSFDARALGIREHLKTDDPIEHLRLRCDEVARKEGLTDREREVMFLLVQGLSRPRVAEALTVSEQTVKTHAKHIYEKLEVHSLREMVLLGRDRVAATAILPRMSDPFRVLCGEARLTFSGDVGRRPQIPLTVYGRPLLRCLTGSRPHEAVAERTRGRLRSTERRDGS